MLACWSLKDGTYTLSCYLRIKVTILTVEHLRRAKTSTRTAIIGESSFNMVSLFTRVMLKEALKLMKGHCKIRSLPCTLTAVASNISLLLSPVLAGFYTEGFLLRAFQHFVFHDSCIKVFPPGMIL
jgi:hypothetical protein